LELRVVKVYLEHIKEKAELSLIGYQPKTIPRVNLGNVLLRTTDDETTIMSLNETLKVKANGTESYKFSFTYEEEVEG